MLLFPVGAVIVWRLLYSQKINLEHNRECDLSVVLATAGPPTLSVKQLHPYCLQIFLCHASHPFSFMMFLFLSLSSPHFFSAGDCSSFHCFRKRAISFVLLPWRYDPFPGVSRFCRDYSVPLSLSFSPTFYPLYPFWLLFFAFCLTLL